MSKLSGNWSKTLAWYNCCVVGYDHLYFSIVVREQCILFSFHLVVQRFLWMHNNFRIDSTCWSVLWHDRDFRLLRELDSIQLSVERRRFLDSNLMWDPDNFQNFKKVQSTVRTNTLLGIKNYKVICTDPLKTSNHDFFRKFCIWFIT